MGKKKQTLSISGKSLRYFLLGLFNSPFLAEDEGFDGRFAFGANRKEQSASSCRLGAVSLKGSPPKKSKGPALV